MATDKALVEAPAQLDGQMVLVSENGFQPGFLKRPGFPEGSGYWIPIKGWSVRYAS